MKKNPLKKLFVSSLGKPFYLNVVQFQDKDKWHPMFYAKWAGSSKRMEAVQLRKEASKYLHKKGNKVWQDVKNIKTVRITLFQQAHGSGGEVDSLSPQTAHNRF